MSENNTKVPKIRFPGFADAWEQCKLGEVATFINGRAYKQDELLDKGRYRVLRVGNFYTNGEWYWSDMELGEKYYAENGDLLYTWSATFGPHIWEGEKVIYHYHIWKVELSDQLEKSFAVQLLEYDKAKIFSDKNGSTMVHITKKGMEEKVIVLPSVDEQRRIGEFLDKLNHLITLHQRKLNHLRDEKKSLLQKMFPKNGADVPEIRFPGFTDAWEQRELGKLVDVVRSYSLSRGVETVEDSGFRYVHYGDIHKKVADLIENDEQLPMIKAGYYDLLQKGDVIVADASEDYIGIAEPSVLLNTPIDKVVAGLHTIAMRPKEITPLFLYYLLHTDNFKKFGYRVCTGMKVFGITAKNLFKFSAVLPFKEEQKKIGKFFYELDHLITLHQRKLNHLQEQKKSLLQQMFV